MKAVQLHAIVSGFCLLASCAASEEMLPLHLPFTVPGRVFERMLLVPVRVQNTGPYWFIVDTASPTSAINRSTAKSAGLHLSSDARGLLPESTNLEVGGATLSVRPQVIDLSTFSNAEDLPIGGVLGMDLFRKYAVRLDYDAEVLTFEETSGPCPRSADCIPLSLKSSLPYVAATIKLRGQKTIRRDFLIDTASGDAINDDGFARAGPVRIGPDLGRAEFLLIGRYILRGVNGTSGTSTLGGELLHRFHVTIDLPHSRMILAPNRHYGDRFLFDASGMDIERSTFGLTIVRVFDRTPAKEVGLVSGDEILSIDGQPAKNFAVDQVRVMFHEPGDHDLLIHSHGMQREIELKLRTLL